MNQQDKELLRTELLRILYELTGQGATVCLAGLMLAIRKNGLYQALRGLCDRDIAEALAFLEGMGFVESAHNPMGASKAYRITADGTLFHERNP